MTTSASSEQRWPAGLVDVHAHFLPAAFRDAMRSQNRAMDDGSESGPEWSLDAAIEMMDRNGIAIAVISLPVMLHWGDDEAARHLTRAINESAALAKRQFPSRFGGFASLPLPDVEGALKEIEYSLDELTLDGVCLISNYDGIYLGDPRFEPVFAELGHRGAAVLIHPTAPPAMAAISMGHSAVVIEYPFDTTRAVMNLVLSGTLDRYPGVRLIASHAGGTLPFLATRIANAPGRRVSDEVEAPFREYLRRMYFDTALSVDALQIASLLQIVDVEHVLFGSDWPFAPEGAVAHGCNELASNAALTPEDLERIGRLNALSLLPGLPATEELA